MKDAERHLITLAIYFSTRGASFVLFEGTLSPYDWGIFEVRGPRREAKCQLHITRLLDRYKIDVLVLQNTGREGTRRASRLTTLNAAVEAAAQHHGVPVFKYSRAVVYSSFASEGFSNKQTLAEVIAKHIPAFERHVEWRFSMPHANHLGQFTHAQRRWGRGSAATAASPGTGSHRPRSRS
jgi:hypothetical protein